MEYVVTAVKELTTKRRLVHINYEPAFALYAGEIRKYKIAEQKVLGQSCYEEILCVLSKRAVVRAMNLLKSKDYAETELVRKLKEGYYPAAAVEKALDYVKQYGYVNDSRYAANYVAFKADSKSRRQIEYFLAGKGIDRSLIEQTCNTYYETHAESELQQVVQQMEKKFSKNSEAALTYEQRQKILSYFYRKGFQTDVVKKALDIVVNARYSD